MSRLLRVSVGEETWDWDVEVTLEDAFLIKNACGLAMSPFVEGLDNRDPDCCQTLVWFLRGRPGGLAGRKAISFKLLGEGGFNLEALDDEDPTSDPSGATGSGSTVTTEPSSSNGSGTSPAGSTTAPVTLNV